MPGPELNPSTDVGAREIARHARAALAILRRSWPLVAIATLAGLTASALYASRAQRAYQATARVLILQQGGRPLNVGNSDPTRQVEGADDLLTTHAIVIASPLIVGRAIEAAGKAALPSLARTERPVGAAIANLKVVRPNRAASILQLDYRCGSRAEAILMVGALLESYSRFLDDGNRKRNGDVVSLISRARDELGREVADLERQGLEFRKARPTLAVDESGRPHVARRLERWEKADDDAMVRSVQLRAQLDLGRRLAAEGRGLLAVVHAMSELGGDFGDLGGVIGGGERDAPSDYIRGLLAQQQEMAARHGPEFARVKELREEVGRARARQRESRGDLDRSDVGDLLASVERSLEATESMRAEIAERSGRDREESHRVRVEILAMDNLRTKLDRHRMLFNTVVDQLKQAQFVSDFSTVSAQVIEPPDAPKAPAWPRTSLILGGGAAAGALLGVGAAVVAGRLDQRVRTAEQLQAALGMTLLARVPLAGAGECRPFGLVGHSMPRSRWAESYRAARTNIELLRRSQSVQVLMVASAHPGDGKTATASNLAISLAQAGRRVLLIDGDLRKPSLHRVFGLPRSRGLVQLLRGDLPASGVIQATSVTNLDLIATGPDVPNPAELLSSADLAGLRDGLRPLYDFLVIDSSPLFAVTDPLVLAAAADGIVLVVRPATLRMHEVERLKELLRAVGTPALGAIVNGVGRDEPGYDYSYDYGYGNAGRRAPEPPALHPGAPMGPRDAQPAPVPPPAHRP